MDYQQGTIGRVFVLRFDEGEDFFETFTAFLKKESVRSGWFHILGGMRQADVVTGPREPVIPPEPVWLELKKVHEAVGIGSVFLDGDLPRIHLHTVFGHHGETLCACLRKNAKVYLVLELYLIEVSGMNVSRPWDEKCGFHRLIFD